ncbi:uncharacterized protein TM35_000151400, partial [Trypanosoma theileri]
AIVASIEIMSLCCYFRERALTWCFILLLTVTLLFFFATFGTMLAFGIMYISVYNTRNSTLSGALLISFSFLSLAAAIGIPIFSCYRRKRQIQELDVEERSEVEPEADTMVTRPVVSHNDGKTSV